jgi:transposase
MSDQDHVKRVFEALRPVLNERMRRLVAAAQAQALGHGGVTLVAEATGLARSTITQGITELTVTPPIVATGVERLRRPGGGRKRLTDHDPVLLRDLEALVEPTTRGDPESPLRWTCKSLSKLAEALGERGHRISGRKVGDLLRDLGYSLQANRKTQEGASHPDRNAQFEHINVQALAFQQRGQPVISVDTKKKELVGEFKNSGREWQPKGQPELVQVHDFPSQALGKAIPYGVYDVGANEGWVSVGTDHDTAEFAVATVRRWWQQMGAPKYPDATELLIMADGGGSNGNRSRLWKVALQQFANDTGLRLSVCHFPPGTSKWNKIEHRMFSHITQNWRGRPLVSHEVVVNLIGSTTTRAGLQIRAVLDSAPYPTKKQVSDDELAAVQISLDSFHGEWNYSIHPRSSVN